MRGRVDECCGDVEWCRSWGKAGGVVDVEFWVTQCHVPSGTAAAAREPKTGRDERTAAEQMIGGERGERIGDA